MAHDVSFAALGTTVRLIADEPGAVDRARAAVLDYHARLSRFEPDSELSALNDDPRPAVPASPLLRAAIRAALWAARFSDGLVDPCLLDGLVAAGYDRSYERPAEVPHPCGPYRAARPDPAARWRRIVIDDAAGTVTRPPGLRLDLGGTGKGHIADLAARAFHLPRALGTPPFQLPRAGGTAATRLARCRDWVVDCGGDVRIGGTRRVLVAHPLRDEPAGELTVTDGAVATSSVMSRGWVRSDGRPAHHLLDPSTREPVRTGLLSATATAPTTLHAETLAKLAVLQGAAAARTVLASLGGVLVHEDGRVETIAPTVALAA